MRPIPLTALLLSFAAAPAMAQLSPPPHSLGTMPAGQMHSQAAPAAAPMMTQAAPEPPIARPGNVIGTGQSLPLSDKAGNIGPSDTTTPYAARLPDPSVEDNAAPRAFLEAARTALAAGQTGEAQEALERAETRLLIRSVRPSQANNPITEPVVQQVSEARHALGQGDRAGALDKIAAALANPELAAPVK